MDTDHGCQARVRSWTQTRSAKHGYVPGHRPWLSGTGTFLNTLPGTDPFLNTDMAVLSNTETFLNTNKAARYGNIPGHGKAVLSNTETFLNTVPGTDIFPNTEKAAKYGHLPEHG